MNGERNRYPAEFSFGIESNKLYILYREKQSEFPENIFQIQNNPSVSDTPTLFKRFRYE